MWTRGKLTHTYAVADTGLVVLPAQSWVRGPLVRAGVQSLQLPNDSAGGGYAYDPSDPRTWRRPVQWT